MRVLYLFCLFILTGCILTEEPDSTFGTDANLLKSGDIVVANTGNDTILLLDQDGILKEILTDSTTDPSLNFSALAFDRSLDQILVAFDSTVATSDRIIGISMWDGTLSNVLQNSNYTGILSGIARLNNGSFVGLEGTTTMELFDSNGVRSGNPFSSAITANGVDVNPLSTGGYVVCSTGVANTVRTYSSTGVLVSTATSAAPAPTLGALAASSCISNSLGQIIVAYSGATDHIRAYNSTLTTVLWTYNDSNVLATPGKLAITPAGNILVSDIGLNHIVELNSSGGFVRTIGGNVLAAPVSILVIP